MHESQHFLLNPAYNAPGLGNYGHYDIARALGLIIVIHQMFQNDLLKKLKTHCEYYVKLYGSGGKTGQNINMAHTQGNIKLAL